jgi:hypothetical protein
MVLPRGPAVPLSPEHALCVRCHVYMVEHSVQIVDGPEHTPVHVHVYECPSCEVLRAEDMGSSWQAAATATRSEMSTHTHQPSQRSIQRWENEGGATKGARAGTPVAQSKNTEAANLAGQVIDRLGDRLATTEERKTRKSRLLRGPKEFGTMRRDQRN